MKQVDGDTQRELERRINQAERKAEELVERERLSAAEEAERSQRHREASTQSAHVAERAGASGSKHRSWPGSRDGES